MAIMDFWKRIKQGDPVTADTEATAQAVRERADDGIFKAYIPNFLYKPPYGMPRREPVQRFRVLARNSYIFSVIKTLCDEATAVPWEIRVKEDFQEDGVDYSEKIKEITRFFNNPNGNDESLEHIERSLITDILEVDSAVLVKIFNLKGEFKQMFARDGALFLKNPDIYGYMGNRAEFVLPLPDAFTGVSIDLGGTPTDPSQQQIMKQYSLQYKDQAAYFQYGWTAGSLPVPFGTREVVYMMQMPRSDTIYGTSPISRLQETIECLIYGTDSQLDIFTNSNMPEGVIQLLGAQQAQLKQFRENFEKQFRFEDALGNSRKKFHKVPMSTSPVEFTKFTLSAKEMEFIAQQTWFTKILWMCFGVNADEMGFTEDSNRATGDSQIKTFKRKAIRPLLSVLQYHFNGGIMPEFFPELAEDGENIPDFGDVPLEFVYKTVDNSETKQELDVFEQKIRMGIMTPEMVAKELGVDVAELQAAKDMEQEKQIALFQQTQGSKNQEEKEEDNKTSSKKETVVVEEKADNPLKEIENYIDDIGTQLEKAVGNMNERELNNQRF